jgi:hypothetical protein
MENGLPSDATLSIARPAGFAYDLVDERPVPVEAKQGKLAMQVRLGPCDGRVYMISSRPIDRVTIEAPEKVERGKRASCVIRVVDAEGKPLDAVVPVEVTIRDAEARLAEFSGFYAAVDGVLRIDLDIASNDPPGVWQITARELASGQTAAGYLRVLGPEPWPPVAQREQ